MLTLLLFGPVDRSALACWISRSWWQKLYVADSGNHYLSKYIEDTLVDWIKDTKKVGGEY